MTRTNDSITLAPPYFKTYVDMCDARYAFTCVYDPFIWVTWLVEIPIYINM